MGPRLFRCGGPRWKKELPSGDRPRVRIHAVGRRTQRGSSGRLQSPVRRRGQDQDEWRLPSGACLERPQNFNIIYDQLRRHQPLDRTKTIGAFQAVPVWNIQAIFLNFYKHSEPTMSERDQDEWRLASGAGLDRSTLTIHQINYKF